MKKIFKKIDFVTLFLVIILIIVSFCYAQLKVFGKEHIEFCGYTLFQVITGSMEDTIKIKDIVIVKLTDDVKENDIITYKNDGNFVTHRIIRIEDDQIVTKGDANNSEDDPIRKGDIVGKVVFIISNVAVWIQVLKTPQVIIAILVTIVAIWLLFIRPKDDRKPKD